MRTSERKCAVRRKADDQTTINQETIEHEGVNQETVDGQEAADCPDAASEEEQYLKRYRHCRRLIENDGRFIGMTDEEKDAYAQRLATPEYLDLRLGVQVSVPEPP